MRKDKKNISSIKTKVFKDNQKYFNFSKRDDIKIYSVGFTKSRDIKVQYKIMVAGKDIKKERRTRRLPDNIICV